MSIIEVLKRFEDKGRKGFYFHEIIGDLSKTDDAEKKKDDYHYEVLAFQLTPSHGDNPWGYHYGPSAIFTDQDDNPIYDPSLDEITSNAVLYWESRSKTCDNPLMRLRYAGLVWDFKQKIAHQSKTEENYRIYIDSMLTVCNEDYCPQPTATVSILERLFDVTKGQPADLIATKQAYIDFEKRHVTDDSVCCWTSRFLIMLENKRSFEQAEIDSIVQEHEDRLLRLSTPWEGVVLNPWLIEKQAGLLAQYYNRNQKKEEVRRVLKTEEAAFLTYEGKMSAMQLMCNIEKLYKVYRHYGLEQEAKGLSIKIQEFGAKAKDEMKPYQIEFEIPKEVHEQADQLFGDKAKSDTDRWNNFIMYFIPDKDSEVKSLQEQVKNYPLRYMVANKMMDPKGRPMSVVGPYETDPDGQLIMQIARNMNLKTYILGIAINKMIDVGTLTVDNIMDNIVKPSSLFEEDRYPIIQEALSYFINAQYILFCHLIVPQIEYAICNMVELSGVSVIKPQRKGNGFQLQTLDDLLREKVVSDTLTGDVAFYLRLVLTDQRALNIRNSLCHGIFPPEYFQFGAAARLLHVLTILGTVNTSKTK